MLSQQFIPNGNQSLECHVACDMCARNDYFKHQLQAWWSFKAKDAVKEKREVFSSASKEDKELQT